MDDFFNNDGLNKPEEVSPAEETASAIENTADDIAAEHVAAPVVDAYAEAEPEPAENTENAESAETADPVADDTPAPDFAPADAQLAPEEMFRQPEGVDPRYQQPQPYQPAYGYQPYPTYGQPAQQPYTQPIPQRYAQPPYPQQPYPQPPYSGQRPAQPPYQPYGGAYGQPAAQPYNRPYTQPAAQKPDLNTNPYISQPAPAQPYNAYYPAPQPKEQKPRTSTGTKVFLIVLSALLIAMIIGFSSYISYIAGKDSAKQTPDTGITVPDIYDDFFNGRDGDGSDGGSIKNNSSEEFDEEITLVEDNGNTQKRDDDNPDSVGSPDSSAKAIELKALPKDKTNPDYTTQSAYDAVCDSVVTIDLYDGEITENVHDIVGSGTGTIISADGYLVTNAHVVANSRRYAVKVILNSGESYQAKIIGYDTWTDLAVLKIDAKGLTPVVFGDSELIEIGQDVIAIGSPGGEKFRNSLTKGIVSAVDRELSINKYVRYIQSDAAISPGNSGGPLCNIYGQVIGINTAKTTATNYEAMTFSIPSSTVKEIVGDLLRYGYVKGRCRIGLTGTAVTAEDQTFGGRPAGILVERIDPEGSLAGTKIKEGDIITAVDGVEITSFQDIYAVLNEHKAGDKVTVSVYREE